MKAHCVHKSQYTCLQITILKKLIMYSNIMYSNILTKTQKLGRIDRG